LLRAILTRRGASPLYAPMFGMTLDLKLRTGGRAAREPAIAQNGRQVCLRDLATMNHQPDACKHAN
jgi:hypothetical protein